MSASVFLFDKFLSFVSLKSSFKNITMYLKSFLLLFFILIASSGNAQTCTYKNLSKNFDFSVSYKSKNEIKTISLIITQKATKKIFQEINFDSEYLSQFEFKECANVRSYSTGVNKNAKDLDNDFGNLIIGDFNFDGIEDLAIKQESGGNGGPLYNYYIQKNKKFVLDVFLTNTMKFFPSEIDKNKKILITYVHANAYQFSKNLYLYDTKTKKWKEGKSTLIPQN